MRFEILGPIEVRHSGRPLRVGSGRERFVLASLLLNAGRVTQTGTLIDALWTEPPASGKAQLHNMVSNIRGRLREADEDLIRSRPGGYELRLDRHELDLLEFRRLAERGRRAVAAGDHAVAVAALGEAMCRWRGPALADVPDELGAGPRQALHEERLSAAETLLESRLALGHNDEVLRDIDPLLAEHPYREGLHQMRMLALVGAGRRAEALEHYRSAYRQFADDLGVEPGRSLRELERRILQGESPTAIRAPAGPVVPRQLPPPSAALAGRDGLLGEITEALRTDGDAAAVVLLVGPGGVGKTALALAAAHGSAGDFPDGQLYADLRGGSDRRADPHAVLGRFLRALGIDESTLPEDPDERVARYRSELAGRRVLVVLDDAGSERQVRPLLPGANRCRTLITSRSQLGALVGAERWTVPRLDTSDALELLSTIAGPDRVAREPVAAEAIVRLCARLPLAVTIAAARLAVRPHWTLEEFRERLAEQRGRLDELAVGDLDVRASIALSYAALDPPTRQLFRRLGLVNAPTWPAWIVERLADDPAGLEALTDVHLVEPAGRDSVGQHRFRLHDLVAEFAAERALTEDDDADRTAALTRLLTGWLALATEADGRIPHDLVRPSTMDIPDPPAGPARIARERPGDWLEAERRTLALAVDQACRPGLADLAGALALRLAGFLSLRRNAGEWEGLLRKVVPLVREHGSAPVLARVLGSLFLAYLRRDQHAELAGVAAEQLETARRLADRELEARALTHTALADVRVGRFAESLTAAERAVAAARHPDVDTSVLRNALSALAFANMTAGRPGQALPLLEETLAIDRAAGTVLQTALHLYHYGMALAESGRAGEAERPLTEALRISTEFGHIERTAYLEQVLADVAIRTGRLSMAAVRLERSRAGHERIGGGDGLAEALRSTGDLAAAEGRWRDAISWLHRALDIFREIESGIEVARTLARLEHAHTAVGEPDAAAACGRECRAVLAGMSLDEACLYLPPVY